MWTPRSRRALATKLVAVSATSAPISRSPSRCCSTRRIPMSSPPGLAISASPVRPTSAPNRRKEPLIRWVSSAPTSAGCTCAASSRQRLAPRRSTSTPRWRSIAAIVPMSSISGTFSSSRGWSVSRDAAITGRAAFLLPEIATSPVSGPPPVIRSRSIAPTVHESGGKETGG